MTQAFTYDQWKELIPGIETLDELSAYEEMLRSDCQSMMPDTDKITDLTGLMRAKHTELTQKK